MYFAKRMKVIYGISVLFSLLYGLMHLPSPLSSWGLILHVAGQQTHLSWVPLLAFRLLFMGFVGLLVGAIAENGARLFFGR